ncbi:MAG: hypothetical protein H6658_10740 [Ardenticatenaceae bacterium]|nr:hypothetical protein [Ardenticatenaceae bacterium]
MFVMSNVAWLKLNRVLLCCLVWIVGVWLLVSWGQTAVAQPGCAPIYNQPAGWVIEICPTDPDVGVPMTVTLNGAAQGTAAYIRFAHPAQADPGQPQVAVIYASGYVRLKQNADPVPPIPFGTSFVLGPAYWADSATYYHNPQLTELAVDTSWLPEGPIRMTAVGQNGAFDVQYELTLPTPRDRQTRLHVNQVYTATTAVAIDPIRRDEAQGFKLVQFSSMFVNEGQPCVGGHSDCHDSNALRFIGDDLIRHQLPFTTLVPSTLLLTTTVPLGSTWVDVLHTDDESWQGNTPNTRIALDVMPLTPTVTVQGWISATNSPDEDNVGVWLHDDGPASQSWAAGQNATVGYWLLAQDNPPEPWSDLDLRTGEVLLDFEGAYDCYFVKDAGQATSGSIYEMAGYTDTAVQLDYDLGSDNGNWTQLRCDFDPPLDLSAYDHLRFDWRGDWGGGNSLEVALMSLVAGQERIFGRGYHHATQHGWWGQMVIPFNFLHPWTISTTLNTAQISSVFFSVVKDPVADVGGNGRIAFDNISAFNAISRSVPTDFEEVGTHMTATETAVNWLISQQQPSGLLQSWAEDTTCAAHIYDQALAMLVFSHQGHWAEASAIVTTLGVIQNLDGSWFKAYDCAVNPPTDISGQNRWEGDVAWAVYALNRYLALGGSHPQAEVIRNKAADWLVSRIDTADGCLVIDHTEGTIDAWWALQGSGPAYREAADGLRKCLLTYYWDEAVGRFKGGRDWQQPYLDNQTWGAAFLQGICQPKQGLRALSYARATLVVPAQGGQGYGLDGQAGPWSVWHEGMGQYVALGGEGARDLLWDLFAQQEADGSMPASFDVFSGGGVWTAQWHGVAPTAWFIFALNDLPFTAQGCLGYLPFLQK